MPVQGQPHADLHVEENILSEKSRNDSMEIQEKKTCLAIVGFDCAGFGTSSTSASKIRRYCLSVSHRRYCVGLSLLIGGKYL